MREGLPGAGLTAKLKYDNPMGITFLMEGGFDPFAGCRARNERLRP